MAVAVVYSIRENLAAREVALEDIYHVVIEGDVVPGPMRVKGWRVCRNQVPIASFLLRVRLRDDSPFHR
jgi:hypothetical protein